MKLSRRYLPTTSHADRECRPLLSGSRCSSRVPDDRYRREEDPTILRQAWPLRYSNRRKRLPRPLSRTRYRFEMEFLERIDIRSWKLWRNATPSCELVTLRLVFFIVGHTLRNLRVSLLSNIQRVPSSHSRPMNRERDSFPASTRGKKRREERNGSPWRSANRFVCAANESRLRIDHESFARGKWIFFPRDEGNLFRRMRSSPIFHFNRKFFSSPRSPC